MIPNLPNYLDPNDPRAAQFYRRQYQLDCSLSKETAAGLDPFQRAYIEAAMWTLTTDDGESADHLGLHDIAEETITTAKADCDQFRAEAAKFLEGADRGQAGHDFWLTRNGHGTGYWDRSRDTYPNDPDGEHLNDLADHAGGADWYIGDDGMVYQS